MNSTASLNRWHISKLKRDRENLVAELEQCSDQTAPSLRALIAEVDSSIDEHQREIDAEQT